jgi:hypothetical protein
MPHFLPTKKSRGRGRETKEKKKEGSAVAGKTKGVDGEQVDDKTEPPAVISQISRGCG